MNEDTEEVKRAVLAAIAPMASVEEVRGFGLWGGWVVLFWGVKWKEKMLEKWCLYVELMKIVFFFFGWFKMVFNM